jgi:hypothetical protein
VKTIFQEQPENLGGVIAGQSTQAKMNSDVASSLADLAILDLTGECCKIARDADSAASVAFRGGTSYNRGAIVRYFQPILAQTSAFRGFDPTFVLVERIIRSHVFPSQTLLAPFRLAGTANQHHDELDCQLLGLIENRAA